MKRFEGLVIAMAVVMLSGAGPARSQTTQAVSPADAARTMVGPWTMVLKVPIRNCRVELTTARLAKQPDIMAATIPQRCRWAIPALAKATGWTMSDRNWPQFVDGSGRVVLSFERNTGPILSGKTGANDYMMEAFGTGIVADNDRRHAIANVLAGKDLPVIASTIAVDPRQVPGNYGVARDRGRSICSISLTSRPGKAGHSAADLAGGCLDSGLKIFDPVAWRLDKSRLVLIARKGHETTFTPLDDGTWSKDPPGNSPMFLKKQ